MSWALIAGLVWIITANVLAMMPSRDNHWRRAYVLMAVGFPLLAWIFWAEGFWIAGFFLLAGASVLRWPLRYLWRWMRRITIGQPS